MAIAVFIIIVRHPADTEWISTGSPGTGVTGAVLTVPSLSCISCAPCCSKRLGTMLPKRHDSHQRYANKEAKIFIKRVVTDSGVRGPCADPDRHSCAIKLDTISGTESCTMSDFAMGRLCSANGAATLF
jgi:hypothetical protein